MSFFSDLLGSSAAKASRQAGQIQARAADKAGERAIGYLQPYEATGRQGYNLLADALGINGPEKQAAYFAGFQNDPGYQATLRAGTDAIEQSATGAGNFRSGNTQRELFSHGQRQQFGQFQDRLNRLTGVGESGLQTAGNMAEIKYGSELSKGNALASGLVGAANAKMQGANNLLTGVAGIARGISGFF